MNRNEEVRSVLMGDFDPLRKGKEVIAIACQDYRQITSRHLIANRQAGRQGNILFPGTASSDRTRIAPPMAWIEDDDRAPGLWRRQRGRRCLPFSPSRGEQHAREHRCQQISTPHWWLLIGRPFGPQPKTKTGGRSSGSNLS